MIDRIQAVHFFFFIAEWQKPTKNPLKENLKAFVDQCLYQWRVCFQDLKGSQNYWD